jgi:hypothetical protein
MRLPVLRCVFGSCVFDRRLSSALKGSILLSPTSHLKRRCRDET